MKGEQYKTSNLSIIVAGAGAIGGITAALLKRAGYDVEILCNREDYAKLISEKGLEIRGAAGDFSITIPSFYSADSITDKKDIILLATKATDIIQAANSILPILKENGYLVSMQNGFCEDILESIVGMERVVGCVVGWGATMDSEGKLFMSSSGDFILGYTNRKKDQFIESLAEIMSSVVPSKTTDNITGHLYSKLIINSCVTTLGAVCGLFLGKMLAKKKIRKIFIEIMREAILVADEMQINVEVFGGKIDFKKFLHDTGFFGDMKRHLVICIIGLKYRKIKSSSLQSLERGKKTEIDYLNGYIVKNGLEKGVAVPVNTYLVKLIHEIENGARKISVKNFDDAFFDRFK